MMRYMKRFAESHYGLILGLILLAFAVRVYNLDRFAFRGDESFTVRFSTLPADELIEGIRMVEPNPPLYYYSLRGWIVLAGQSEFSTRFFSLVFGVLAVPLIYILGRALAGRTVGLLAAVIVTINPFQIWHSQDVRNYTLWPMLVIISWWFLWRALQHRRSRDWFFFGLFTLLGLYTHYYQLFIVLAENVLLAGLIFWRGRESTGYARARRQLLVTWCVVQIALVVGFVAWLAVGTTSALMTQSNGSSPTLDELAQQTVTSLLVGQTVPKQDAIWLALPAMILVIIGVIVLNRQKQVAAGWLLIGILVPTLCVFLVSRVRPLFEPRYLNETAPAYYLLAAASIAAFAQRSHWQRRLGFGMAGIWLIVSCYSVSQAWFNPRFAKSPDWRARAAYLESNQQPGDVIIVNYPDPSLMYIYYRGDAPMVLVPASTLDEKGRLETERTLSDLLSHYRRIWLMPVVNSAWDYDSTVEHRLERSADRVRVEQVAGATMELYETPSEFGKRIQRIDVGFEQGIHLLGYRVKSNWVKPGETIDLVLYWQADSRVPLDYTIFMHVLDADGRLRAQQDNPPVSGFYPTSQWTPNEMIVDAYHISLPPNLPYGNYALEVGLYDGRTQVRLSTTTGADHVILPIAITVKGDQ